MLRPKSTSLLIASLLAACGGGGGGDTVGMCPPSATSAPMAGDPAPKEVSENIGQPGDPAAYADRDSVAPGERIGFHVAVIGDDPANVWFEFSRLGSSWQQDGWNLANVAARSVPDNGWEDCCNWPETVSFQIPENWKSGLYRASFSTADGINEVYFVVRAKNPGSGSKIVVSVPMTTAQAYNAWGGKSVYEYNSSSDTKAEKLSMSRPFAGNSRDKYTAWMPKFIEWAQAQNEGEGIDLEFIANTDLHHQPGILEPYDLFVTVGHDEYWSAEMRQELERHLEAGGNAAFFSGNNMWWKIRFEDPSAGLPRGRMLVDKSNDPVRAENTPELHQGNWFMTDPEVKLFGAGYARGGWREDFIGGDVPDFIVKRPGHWAFAGTGLAKDAGFGAGDEIISFESDGADFTWGPGGVPVPTTTDGAPAGLEILATAQLQLGDGWSNYLDEAGIPEVDGRRRVGKSDYTGVPGAWTTMVAYEHSGGGEVFNAATVDWVFALFACGGATPAVECRITKNVIDRLKTSQKGAPAPAPEPGPAPAPEPGPAPAPEPGPAPAPEPGPAPAPAPEPGPAPAPEPGPAPKPDPEPGPAPAPTPAPSPADC
ncbi:MAG: hypothetical protein M9951_12485 [Burkholderiaceae bacterium]|nr:hypothetical protein [Burkholderiaceae bacterium]